MMLVQYPSLYNSTEIALLESMWRKDKRKCMELHFNMVACLLFNKLPKECVQIVVDHAWQSSICLHEVYYARHVRSIRDDKKQSIWEIYIKRSRFKIVL